MILFREARMDSLKRVWQGSKSNYQNKLSDNLAYSNRLNLKSPKLFRGPIIFLTCALSCILILMPAYRAPIQADGRQDGKGENEMKSKQPGRVRAPELAGGHGWLNTNHALKISDLRGKIVLLDFWTYCCINCMHI